MRLMAFSDLHCDLGAAAKLVTASKSADLVIGAGDFAQGHEGLAETMTALSPMDEKAVYVPGNNETEAALRAATRAEVRHKQGFTFEGVTFGFLGCAVPPLPPNSWGSYDMTEDEAAIGLLSFGEVDVVISHSPPKGACDDHKDLGPLGSDALRGYIEVMQPQLVLCGHIHDCWGREARIGKTLVRNLGPTANWFEL
ncbi:metallophosphoesterase family protein [Pontivivens insulae]|uniref:Calcineurin-like phosphoesterase domain-containing protein n=1 Tax=Pontivivens insulae TaxID=1639689 RepID=A0A2R8A780_9RHOB|nr:metallophosphoesterase family protein [Pontivivens insulae]RED18196.1 Icc-related predicted phosphoesterase [Pontivivens insulae]SPF28094.1 hypothetical protein POI8812_00392 [Pontivivens insulae]